MRPTLRQLQYIVAVAETGRFADAARRLNVSQPSLSAQIADAEATLGVTLIERAPSGAVLTPKGEEFVTRARLILSQMDDLKASMTRPGGTLTGRLRLGVKPSIGPYLLPLAVKRLHLAYPEFRLSVREARTIDLEQGLREGALDIVISTPEDHPGMACRTLFAETLYICAAPDDALAGTMRPVAVADLAGRELITVGFGHRLNLIVQNLADAAGAHVSAEFEGTSLDAARQMAAMGAGVAILPSLYALTEARRDPDLVIRPIDHALARRDIALIWRPGSPLDGAFVTLSEELGTVANQLLAVGREVLDA